MKQILVPIDLTTTSINALNFALRLFPNSHVHVLNVRDGMLDFDQDLPQMSGKIKEPFWIRKVQKIIKEELSYQKIPDRISIHVAYGTVVNTINTYTNDLNIDAIVMATKDNYEFLDKWLGSISMGIVKTSNVPVYLIPKYSKFQGFNKVVLASNKNVNNPATIEKIKNWNKDFKSFLKFVHIKTQDSDQFNQEYKSIVESIFNNEDPEFGFEVSMIDHKNISHALLSVAHNSKADLLVLFPENQSFISFLLLKNLTKEIIKMTDIPLLFLNK